MASELFALAGIAQGIDKAIDREQDRIFKQKQIEIQQQKVDILGEQAEERADYLTKQGEFLDFKRQSLIDRAENDKKIEGLEASNRTFEALQESNEVFATGRKNKVDLLTNISKINLEQGHLKGEQALIRDDLLSRLNKEVKEIDFEQHNTSLRIQRLKGNKVQAPDPRALKLIDAGISIDARDFAKLPSVEADGLSGLTDQLKGIKTTSELDNLIIGEVLSGNRANPLTRSATIQALKNKRKELEVRDASVAAKQLEDLEELRELKAKKVSEEFAKQHFAQGILGRGKVQESVLMPETTEDEIARLRAELTEGSQIATGE